MRPPVDTPSSRPSPGAEPSVPHAPAPFATGPSWWAPLTLLTMAALFIGVAAALRSGSPPSETELGAVSAAPDPGADPRLDLNTATAAQLELLPRIGPALARRIVEFREARGPFTSVAQLDLVQGIGPRTIEVVAPLVRISPPAPGTPAE